MLIQPMNIFGFIIPSYMYLWGYTKPQVDLLLSDSPKVHYKDSKEKKKVSKSKMDRLKKEWETKQATQGDKPITLDSLGF